MNTVRHTSEVTTPNPYPPYTNGRAADLWGIHPLNAVILVVIDWMLFGGEAASGGLAILLSIAVGAFLVLPCSAVQRYAFRDPVGLALAKGCLMGLITAIPTALPSAFTIALGITGGIALRHRSGHDKAVDIGN